MRTDAPALGDNVRIAQAAEFRMGNSLALHNCAVRPHCKRDDVSIIGRRARQVTAITFPTYSRVS